MQRRHHQRHHHREKKNLFLTFTICNIIFLGGSSPLPRLSVCISRLLVRLRFICILQWVLCAYIVHRFVWDSYTHLILSLMKTIMHELFRHQFDFWHTKKKFPFFWFLLVSFNVFLMMIDGEVFQIEKKNATILLRSEVWCSSPRTHDLKSKIHNNLLHNGDDFIGKSFVLIPIQHDFFDFKGISI